MVGVARCLRDKQDAPKINLEGLYVWREKKMLYRCVACRWFFRRDRHNAYCSNLCKDSQEGTRRLGPGYVNCYNCEKKVHLSECSYHGEICRNCYPTIPKDHFKPVKLWSSYVYEWLDGTQVFYVGKGTCYRFSDAHNNQRCGDTREEVKQFIVRIVADNLEDHQAVNLEDLMIRRRYLQGHPLTNNAKQLAAFQN